MQLALVSKGYRDLAYNTIIKQLDFWGAISFERYFQDWCQFEADCHNVLIIDEAIKELVFGLSDDDTITDRLIDQLQLALELRDLSVTDVKVISNDKMGDSQPQKDLQAFFQLLGFGTKSDLTDLAPRYKAALQDLLSVRPQMVIGVMQLAASPVFKQVYKQWQKSRAYQQFKSTLQSTTDRAGCLLNFARQVGITYLGDFIDTVNKNKKSTIQTPSAVDNERELTYGPDEICRRPPIRPSRRWISHEDPTYERSSPSHNPSF